MLLKKIMTTKLKKISRCYYIKIEFPNKTRRYEVKMSLFTLRNVGTLLELIIAFKPKWYSVGIDLMRDDFYDGCKSTAPVLMKGVEWKEFWELAEPIFCCSEPGAMYIRLRRLF
jgi:hypothetical protein